MSTGIFDAQSAQYNYDENIHCENYFSLFT